MLKTTRYILTLIAVMILTVGNAWGAINPTEPSKDASGVYQIGTAEELWGFANLVNSTSGTNIALNAKLTDDIELPAQDFPMIGVYNTKKYAGTFDGDGHTISGLRITSTATGIGLFRITYGATIKNFKLSGNITVTNGTSSTYFVSSVVGFADNNTKIEDVSSSVNITFNGGAGGTGGVRIVGGIAGRVKGTLNRCRYNGTIDASNASAIGDRLAGICAEGNTTLNITNCLFDGTIKTACTATGNNHRVGGVVAFANGATVKVENCLSVGSYEFAATASLDNCGVVLGVTDAATCSDSYYTTTSVLSRIGTTKSGVTAVGTTPWSTITDNLNGGSSVTDCNWKVVTGQEWPIPMAWTKTNYTIIFKDWDGTTYATKYVEQGGTLTLPDEPSREGYTFTGWSPEVVMQPTKDATYNAEYSVNKYDVKYYVDNVLTYTDSYDYGANVTAHTAPSKDRYIFSGWSEIPSTMPANNVRVDGTFTYTANASGVYDIGNREDYVNFVAVTKTNVAACAKLIDNINLNNVAVDCIGSSSASYTGTFDGQGYTISNYYRNTTSGSYSGLFAHVTNATIRNFKINGNVTIGGNGQQHGSVIGVSTGTTLVEDVWSSVNVTITGETAQVGGFAGRAGGMYNRCRYNGTVSSSTAYDKIGGFASNLRDGSLKNCLFDGTLSLSVDNENLKAGGLAGAVIEAASTVEGCLAHGTITIAHPTDNCGIVIGFADKNITVNKLYYTTTNAGTLPGIGTVTATLTGSAKDVTSWTWADVNEGLNPSTGSVGHWHIVDGQAYPVPGQCEHTHVHTWGDDGYCKFDGARQPISEVDGYYLIANKGQFLAFYEVTQTTPSANAKLIGDIDLGNIEFAGFGKNATGKFYSGTFDGQGHTIKNFTRTCTGDNGCGFFNAIDNATVKDFTLEGNIIFSFSSEQYYNSSVVAYMLGTSKIEDVHSKVNATMTNGKTRLYGGILGRGTGTVNRCRYSGTVNASTSYDQIAGICASANGGLTISNCLFDGSITSESTNASLCMGGIVAKTNVNNNTLSNNLVKGTISPSSNTYAYCGVVIGNASNTISMDRCYYVGVGSLPAVGTPTKSTGEATLVDPSTAGFNWLDILVALNNGSSNWGIQTETYPVPGDKAAQNYTITFDTNGGTPETIDPIVQPEGSAITAPTAPTKTGYDFAGWNPELPATMPNGGLSVTATWTLAEFKVYYYVDNTLYQTVPVKYTETITPLATPTKDRYTFSGWSEIPATMPASDVRIDGTFTFTANASGVYEIGNREDYVNFVNITKTNAAANAKVIADINLNSEPVEGIGSSTTPYTGTFDGQRYSISGYVRNVIGGNYGGMFNYTNNATIRNFSLAGTMSIAGTAQQYGSVIGCSAGNTLVEDVYSSVNVTISSTASQVGGFVGRAGGTYNRCRYDGTVSSETAYDKIGGFAGNILTGTLTNCLFDGTITLSAESTDLKTSAFVASSFGNNPHVIKNCLVNGTMNITHPNDNCGIVVGYYEQALTVDHTYYTGTGNAITGAKGTLTGRATPVGTLTMAQLCDALNPTSGTDGNWEIKAGKDYPVPSKCTITEHQHSYNANGFCISGDAYEPATRAQDGYYEIDNAGKLWWIAQQLNATENGLPKNTRIKLTSDIDMEGDKHGSFPGICPLGTKPAPTTENPAAVADDWEGTAFQGIFDGQGKTINNYYRLHDVSGLRRGFINSAKDATIRKFNINGEVKITTTGAELALSGVVLGSATGTSKIEDIHSSVNVTSPAALLRGFGGVIGALEDKTNTASVTMNRCRYSGTMSLNGEKTNQNIGGVVGEIRSAVMNNCMFDGKIEVASTVPYTFVGGLVGKVGTNDNSEIHRALVHGTITLNGYAELTNEQKTAKSCGIVIGGADRSIYLNKVYHTITNVTSGLDIIGPHTTTKVVNSENDGVVGSTITVDLMLGTSTDKTGSAELYDGTLRQTLGTSNWAAVENTSGNYTYPLKDESHIHKYSNGFCTANDGDYQQPNIMDKTYQIANGGNLYWFAEHFNAGEIPQDAVVEIMTDIDMEGTKNVFPGIGTSTYKFTGQFLGNDFTLKNYHRDIVNAEGTGLINYAENVTIKQFILKGNINFNLSTVKSFHGTVVGMCTGASTVIEDVSSMVDVKMNNPNVRVFGGIAGRSAGIMNRCQYLGTMTCDGSGQQIGGICANAKDEITISNCLFAGKINCTDATHPVMRVSGILSSNEKGTGAIIVIKDCLFNGCLEVNHTYPDGPEKSTENGIIAGYWDSTKPSIINNVFYITTTNCTMNDVPVGGWQTNPNTENYIKIDAENSEYWDSENNKPKWDDIFKVLDEVTTENPEGNGDWEHTLGSNDNPVPNLTRCKHYIDTEHPELYFDEFGYCKLCGFARPLVKDEDGTYHMDYVSDLASFRDMVNSAKEGSSEVYNAKLTEDIDFANFENDFGEPIGNNYYNRYLYNFDGQGHKLLNVKITTQNEFVGFFGFAGDPSHDCQIHDFTITGEIEVPYDSKEHNDAPLCMGVVGKMFRGSIYNVHSELTMKNTNATRAKIGGIVGCIETENDQHSVVIDKCSYTGVCYANAVGDMGGIVGLTSKNTEVKNCTFAGVMNHTYQGGNNTTQFGGIVGKNEESSFKGVQNCVIAGVLKTDKNRTFVSYDEDGNHKNILCGYDTQITDETNDYNSQYSGNYALEDYIGKFTQITHVEPEYVSQAQMANGEVCAIMNAKDDNTSSIQDGHPWGQILGYQIGDFSKGELIGAHTDGSPAQRVPLPGYQNPEKKTWKVTTTTNTTWNAKSDEEKAADPKKYDYTAAWYYFDDQGDSTPFPTDAASLKVKKIEYHRAAEHLTGYNSFCLPFEFTNDMAKSIDATDAVIYKYNSVDETNKQVKFTPYANEDKVPAGTPFILYANKDEEWKYIKEDADGITIPMNVTNPASDDAGIYGSFDTMEIGWGYWKLTQVGDHFVRTVGKQDATDKPEDAPTDKEISHCYPYRAYLKLPEQQTSAPVKEYVPVFEDGVIDIENDADERETLRYNIMGQRVNKNAKGIIIVNGKKYLKIK